LFGARRLHCYLYNACIFHRQTEYRQGHKSVDYLTQQNLLPAFKKEWVEFAALNAQSLQGTLKRVDLAYQSFFKGLRSKPKFKSIRDYSGWTYPSFTGWKVNTQGKHGTITLNDLGITLKMRGKAKEWAELKNRYHVCPDCGFEVPRDLGSAMVMYNVAINQQPGLGKRSSRTSLVSLGCFSATAKTRKHTGSMKHLGQMKRQKSQSEEQSGVLETLSRFRVKSIPPSCPSASWEE
jgi:transposase